MPNAEFSQVFPSSKAESTSVGHSWITDSSTFPEQKKPASVLTIPTDFAKSFLAEGTFTSRKEYLPTPTQRSATVKKNNKTMLTCFGVADYFLAQVNEESGDLISNLKLQKLMYYGQGFHLALYNKPLFPEPIEAWMYGPVVPVLYHELKKYGAGALPLPKIGDFSIYTPEVRELLDEIYDVYGQYSAWKLAQMTHDEQPWKSANESKGVISLDSMKSFFRTRLVSEEN